MGKVIIPNNDAVAVVDEGQANWNGKDEEEEATEKDAPNNDIIDVEVAAEVEAVGTSIIKAVVATKIVGTIEVVDDNPNDVADVKDDNNEGEGVPGRNTSDCCLSPPSHFFFVRKQKKLC